MGQDEDLVLEALRPVGDLGEMEMLPGARAVAVALLDERAFEKEQLRPEDLGGREVEEARRRVARKGHERDRDLARNGLPAQSRRADVAGATPGIRGKKPPPDLRGEKAERGDAVVGGERRDAEVTPEKDRLAWSHRLDTRVVSDPFQPLMEREKVAPEGDRVGVRPRHASRHPVEPPLRAPVREPRRVVEVCVREEEVRHGEELRRRTAHVEGQAERREVEPGLPAGRRDAPEGDPGVRPCDQALTRLAPHPGRLPVLYWDRLDDQADGEMALFNYSTRDLTAKIVYYGPGLCGKTTNLRVLHGQLDRAEKGKLLSLATAQERTIYFDLLPVELGNIKGYTVRFQLCTVPGQVFYNETRKIVLRGVDGIVFVVDSQGPMLSHNLESFQNLRDNLREEKVSLETIPIVVQYNKRDLPTSLPIPAVQESLGFGHLPFVEAVASEGKGVVETFRLISKLTFVDLLRRLQKGGPVGSETAAAALAAATAAVPEVASVAAPEPVFAHVEAEPTPEPQPEPAVAVAVAVAGDENLWETSCDHGYPDVDDEPSLDSSLVTEPLFSREAAAIPAAAPPAPEPEPEPGSRMILESDLATTVAIEVAAPLVELPPEPPAPVPLPEEAAAAVLPAEVEAPAAEATPQTMSAPDEVEVQLLEDSLARALRSMSEESARREEVEEHMNRRIAALEEELGSLRHELLESRDREESLKMLTEGLSRRWEALRRLLAEGDAPEA